MFQLSLDQVVDSLVVVRTAYFPSHLRHPTPTHPESLLRCVASVVRGHVRNKADGDTRTGDTRTGASIESHGTDTSKGRCTGIAEKRASTLRTGTTGFAGCKGTECDQKGGSSGVNQVGSGNGNVEGNVDGNDSDTYDCDDECDDDTTSVTVLRGADDGVAGDDLVYNEDEDDEDTVAVEGEGQDEEGADTADDDDDEANEDDDEVDEDDDEVDDQGEYECDDDGAEDMVADEEAVGDDGGGCDDDDDCSNHGNGRTRDADS